MSFARKGGQGKSADSHMFLLCSYSGSSQPARRDARRRPTDRPNGQPSRKAGGRSRRIAGLSSQAHTGKRPPVAALAQSVEHIIRNDGVTGSSPVSGTSTFPRTSLDVQLKGLSRGNGNGSSLGHFGKGKWLNRGDISLGLLEFADDPIWQRTCIAPCVTTPVGRFQAVRFRTENERSRY